MKEDPDYVIKVEKAIAKKYGHDTIINPKSLWTDEKEKEYLEQIKEFYEKEYSQKEDTEKVEKDGFFLSKNLITKKSKRKCPICDIYSFSGRDDLYMNKFQCCWRCYIQWVEHREERWETGWRPNKKGEKEWPPYMKLFKALVKPLQMPMMVRMMKDLCAKVKIKKSD